MADDKQERTGRNGANWVLAWSPLLMCVVSNVGTLICFLTALHYEHVTVYVPFISDTGDQPPESGVFAITLMLQSFFGGVSVVYRYMTAKHMIQGQSKRVFRSNKAALNTGIISMCGVTIVGAFPFSNSPAMHIVGAIGFFFFGTAYIVLNTYLTCKENRQYQNTIIRRLRVTLLAILFLSYVGMSIAVAAAIPRWKEAYTERPPRCKRPGDEAFELLVVASVFEWLMGGAFGLYFLTFIPEFRKFRFVAYTEDVSNLKALNESKNEESGDAHMKVLSDTQ